MAVLQSRRAKILANLERQLATISQTNGYATTIEKVTTNVKNWQDTTEAETPILYIVDESTDYKYNPGRLLEHEWTMGIYGVMKNKDQLQMEELIADIEACLFKNVTLSFDGIVPGPAAQVRILNIVTDNQLFSEIEGSQLFKVTIKIMYTGQVDNPR